MSQISLFEKMVGKWEGVCRTWFEPDKLADESAISGDITEVLDGRFLPHRYKSTIQGKAREGEELIAFSATTRQFQISWVDGFHMSDAIMFSQGEAFERGFSVFGEYDVGEALPKWGWRTEFDLIDDDRLTITAFNVTPEGTEVRAIEIMYRRMQ
jgi:hypothetical protein